ncbi:mitochondrial DNA polymerase beta-PAK [Novymonas esmeraldas]|uniref:Mitochondrial DNA polymerase beta-PAK n=1 Tax=Novymonas esmeraldas TaxID=1808958 RepID=A0AAW0EZQ0_9TRYP
MRLATGSASTRTGRSLPRRCTDALSVLAAAAAPSRGWRGLPARWLSASPAPRMRGGHRHVELATPPLAAAAVGSPPLLLLQRRGVASTTSTSSDVTATSAAAAAAAAAAAVAALATESKGPRRAVHRKRARLSAALTPAASLLDFAEQPAAAALVDPSTGAAPSLPSAAVDSDPVDSGGSATAAAAAAAPPRRRSDGKTKRVPGGRRAVMEVSPAPLDDGGAAVAADVAPSPSPSPTSAATDATAAGTGRRRRVTRARRGAADAVLQTADSDTTHHDEAPPLASQETRSTAASPPPRAETSAAGECDTVAVAATPARTRSTVSHKKRRSSKRSPEVDAEPTERAGDAASSCDGATGVEAAAVTDSVEHAAAVEADGAGASRRRRRPAARIRTGKRLRALPVSDEGDGDASAAAQGPAVVEATAAGTVAPPPPPPPLSSSSPTPTPHADAATVSKVRLAASDASGGPGDEQPETVDDDGASARTPRKGGRRQAGGKRGRRARLAAPEHDAAVDAASSAGSATPPAAASADPPASVAAAGVSRGTAPTALAGKRRLSAQAIRRRWQQQQQHGLRRAVAAMAAATATAAAASPDVSSTGVAGGDVDTSAATPGTVPAKRRAKRGRPPAAAKAPSGTPQPKSTTRTAAKRGKRTTTTAAAAASAAAAAVAEVTPPVAEVEDPAVAAARAADVAAAMEAAVAAAAQPESLDEEYDAAAAVSSCTDSGEDVVSRALQQQADGLAGAASAKTAAGTTGSGGATTTGSGGGGGSASGGKGANSKDTLFFPDYRERVVQIFEQLTQINSALGEHFKAQSYGRTVEEFKRGDKAFQLLPPNLLPLPEDDPKKKAMIDALYGDDPAAQRRRADEVARNRAKRTVILSADNLIPGVGTKLREKLIEILVSGTLAELQQQESKPIIRAIRELSQVHGVGPRTAMDYFKKYRISTVAELRDHAIKAGELDMNNKDSGKPASLVVCADKSKFHLNDAQRLGLVYYEDMCHRIPHEEGRVHEAFMKLRLRKYLGKGYELVVCGSYRRQVESAGDIDVLITRKRGAADAKSGGGGGGPVLPPSEVLGTLLAGLKADKYIEATLAQGPTKFMGLCRLPRTAAEAKAGKASGPGVHRARRLDVRYVDSESFPAAMLYFTGSKNFNVIMRSEAIKKNCILNEYGLFRKLMRRQLQQHSVMQRNPKMTFHDMVTRLARVDLSMLKAAEPEEGSGGGGAAASGGNGGEASGAAAARVTAAAKAVKKKGKEKSKQDLMDLREMAKIVERQRVKANTERDIFDALGMDYVSPKDRCV